LTMAFAKWTGEQQLYLSMEGHGREDLFDDIDLSRTVGWFTTIYPVLLTLPTASPSAEYAAQSIKSIKEQLREIPDNGFGYSALRYKGRYKGSYNGSDDEVSQILRAAPQAQVIFNYLGQLDQVLSEDAPFSPASQSSGSGQSDAQQRPYQLSVSSSIVAGKLNLICTYSDKQYRDQTITRLMNDMLSSLNGLIEHCCLPDSGGYTPYDMPLLECNQAQLDTLVAEIAPQVKRQDIDAIYPLSPLQHGMIHHSMLSPDSGVYCVQIACDFTGDMNNDAFRRAWAQIIERHDVFRTMFIGLEQQKAHQVVRKKVRLVFDELDWRDLSEEQQQREYKAFLATDLKRGFDFAKAPMMRFTLIRITDQQHRLIWNLHHSVIDGWSMPIVFTEFISFYEAVRHNKRPTLPEVRQFKEYIAWLQLRDEDQSARFWQDYLKGIDAPTPLMKGQMRDNDQKEVKPVLVQHLLSVELTSAIRSMARENEVTMNIVTQGAWAILLARHNRVDKVLFGSTVSGRPAELTGMENMVGPFINSVPVRIDVPGEQALSSWLQHFHRNQIVQHEHSYTPLVDVHRYSEIAGNVSLFDSLVVFENTPVDSSLEALTWGLEISAFDVWEQTNFPFTLIFNDGEKLGLKAIYNPLCFDGPTIERLLHQYLALLQNMTEQPQWPLRQMALQSATEQQQLLSDWSDINAVYPHQFTIIQLFERRVEQSPNAIAVAFSGDQLSYVQLNEQANQLAHYLMSVGVTPDTLVAICIERSLDMMVGVLGILKAGGAYVPIDPTYPTQRIAFMLEDSAVGIVLCDKAGMAELPPGGQQLICLDTDFGEQMLSSQPVENPQVEIDHHNLAYVLYTSGSTGQPKGVCVEHRSVVRLVHDTDFVELNEHTHILQMAPLGFDAATFEIWGPLLNGGQLTLYPQGPMDVLALSRFIRAQNINTLWLTSALFDQWIIEQDGPSGLRQLLVGGDIVSPHSVAQLYDLDDQVQIINGYGPTEGTTFTCCYAIPRTLLEGQSIPIGKAIRHTQVYVLDEGQLVVPHG
ncbi:MAG: AMP-binding protein, partial [Algicola sp.]|nr:AMP-binding protein [Algicola sp.]